MGLDYAQEKLGDAISYLASSDGDLRQRLANAFWGFHPVRPEDFPTDLQDQYRTIVSNLTKVQATGDEGSVIATTRAMAPVEAKKVAEDLFELFYEVVQRTKRP